MELFKGQILIDPPSPPSFLLLLPSSPGVDTVSSSQSFASRCRVRTASIAAVNLHYLHSVPSSSKTVQHSRLDCENQSSVALNRQECNPLTPGQNTELSPCLSPPNPCVSDFPNPFSSSSSSSSASQQPVALSPSNPFSNASGGKPHAHSFWNFLLQLFKMLEQLELVR